MDIRELKILIESTMDELKYNDALTFEERNKAFLVLIELRKSYIYKLELFYDQNSTKLKLVA